VLYDPILALDVEALFLFADGSRTFCETGISKIKFSVAFQGWKGRGHLFYTRSMTSIGVEPEDPKFPSDGGLFYAQEPATNELILVIVPHRIRNPVHILPDVVRLGRGCMRKGSTITDTNWRELAKLRVIEDHACDGTSLKRVFIPAAVCSIGPYSFISSTLLEIEVDPDNRFFWSKDGLLFSRDRRKFVFCPRGEPPPTDKKALENMLFASSSESVDKGLRLARQTDEVIFIGLIPKRFQRHIMLPFRHGDTVKRRHSPRISRLLFELPPPQGH
jgi:hypothetical protein